MKGVILAGGLGTRLYPLTRAVNKHLLPVYDRPMIYYPLQMMARCGIRDVLVVAGGLNAADFPRLLGPAKTYGLKTISHARQKGAGGIAAALKLARDFAGNSKICVCLGDNLVGLSVLAQARAFQRQARGARILLKKVPQTRGLGVARVRRGRVVGLAEKPAGGGPGLAVAGIYFYDPRVFSIIASLKPSRRGEMEITGVNQAYLRLGQMTHGHIKGWWADAGGSARALFQAGRLVERFGANHG